MIKHSNFTKKNKREYLCINNIISLDRFTHNITDYLKIDIINTILHYMKNYKKNHIKLIKKYKKDVLFSLLETIFHYYKNIDKLIIIQGFIKKKINKTENKLRGPGFVNRTLCKNDQDFLFLDDIYKQSSNYFFSYEDLNNCIWYFDIRSIYRLITTTNLNPYSREKIPDNARKNILKLKNILKKKGINIKLNEFKYKDKKDKITKLITDLTIDINQCGFTFNQEWIHSLSKSILIQLYQRLEDLWNYRIQISNDKKKEIIVPTGIVFNKPIGQLYNKDKFDIIEILIKDINKFDSSNNPSNKQLGFIYLITCLSEFIEECKNYNSWVLWV